MPVETPADTATGAHTGPERRPEPTTVADTSTPPQMRLPDPGKRGHTTIAARVVEKIAVQAVDEIGPAGGAARRLLGVALGAEDGRGKAQAVAQLDGDIAVVALRMSITYPAPIRRTAAAARDRVTARVAELTKVQVKQVDIDITRLTASTAHPRVR